MWRTPAFAVLPTVPRLGARRPSDDRFLLEPLDAAGEGKRGVFFSLSLTVACFSVSRQSGRLGKPG
jgi:hypothetical protein